MKRDFVFHRWMTGLILIIGSLYAQNFNEFNYPLSLSATGFIIAPTQMAFPREFGKILDQGNFKYFRNILISRGEPLSVRCEDGIYRRIRIDPNTGAVLVSSSGQAEQEITRPETLADLKDYFSALKLDQNAAIQKFMTRYFGKLNETSPSQNSSEDSIKSKAEQHQGESSAGNKNRPVQPGNENSSSLTPNTTDASTQKNIPLKRNETEPQPEPKTSSNSIDNKRFQLITHATNQTESSLCGSSLISRKESGDTDEKNQALCQVDFLTAGHCIPTESEIYLNGDPRKPAFDSLELKTPSGKRILANKASIDSQRITVTLPDDFNGRRRFIHTAQGPAIADNTQIQSDYALISFRIACSIVSPDEVAPVANRPLFVNDLISPITQENTIAPSHLTSEPSGFPGQLKANLKNLGSIQLGDSGGPVFNQQGELIGAISTIAVPEGKTRETANAMTFDPKGPKWALEKIRERTPKSLTQEKSVSPELPSQPNPDSSKIPDNFKAEPEKNSPKGRGIASHSSQNQIKKAISDYENLHYQGIGQTSGAMEDLGPRERFDDRRFTGKMFTDIPQGGTGKLRLAYFGPRNDELERSAQANPLIEVRRYDFDSPEHQHAHLFNAQALGVDGLGRKITRYGMDPMTALNSMIQSELPLLKKYLEAKNSQAKPQGEVKSQPQIPDWWKDTKASSPEQEPQTQRDEKRQLSTPAPDRQAIHSLLGSNCIQCHKDRGLNDIASVSDLSDHLKLATDDVIDTMAKRARLSSKDKEKLLEFRNSHENFSSRSSEQPRAINEMQQKPVNACYMNEKEREKRIGSLPAFDSSGSPIAKLVRESLNSKRVVFYDNKSVPHTWQQATVDGLEPDPKLLSEVHPVNEFMYRKMGYHSDAGQEFPWKKPAGTDASPNTASEKFFIPGNNGKLATLVTRTKQNSPGYFGTSQNVNGPQTGWNFENGATFGEILKVTNPETGEKIPFEIRIRRKNERGSWQMDVLRPFENQKELIEGIKKLCQTPNSAPAGCKQLDWTKINEPNLHSFTREQFVNTSTLGTKLDPLKLSRTAGEALNKTATLQVLPELPNDIVAALLKNAPFKSVFGKPWNKGQNGSGDGWAPTSSSSFNIVPKNYFGGLIPTTQSACLKCHDTAGKHVDNFDPRRDPASGITSAPDDAPRARTWYDFVPGNDGILSWHPFDPRQVSGNGIARPSSFIDCMKNSGLLK
jgi:hypothetical protein